MSGRSVDHPIPDEGVSLQMSNNAGDEWQTIAMTHTNVEGYFEFNNVPPGTYRIVIDITGLDMINPEILVINENDSIVNIVYEVTEEGINNVTGIISCTEEDSQIKIYPNPVKNQLRITNYAFLDQREKLREGDYTIFNVAGQIVGSGFKPDHNDHKPDQKSDHKPDYNSEITIDVSHLPNGIYFIKIGNQVGKFVKK